MQMKDEQVKKSPTSEETRRGFLKKSGKVAAGAAIALPIVMTLSPDKARAAGSCGRIASDHG
ncbi:MAG: twin-arginine translocation signal domain-containing protein [Myxococcota bacterium]